MAKTILISTFQLKCVILTSLPPNSVSIEQMEERPAAHIMLLSNRLLNTRRLEPALRVTLLLCNCPIPAINQLLFRRNKACVLSALSQSTSPLRLFCLTSSRANSTFGLCLRFLWRPAGSCCLSSKCGPGSIFSTSSMLRHPGLAKTCVSRMLRGA